jgi:hypothetical protein
MSDAQPLQKLAQLAAELRTVVCLDAAQREGERVEDAREGTTDSGHRALFQDSRTQEAAAVVNKGKLESLFREVFEVHLRTLAGKGFGVADPDGLGLAWTGHQSAAATEYPVDATQAAADEAGLLEVGVQTAHAGVQLAMAAADNVQHLARESVRAPARPP